ncbi:TonB-linked outer membrane protein, SusC/RagA family [Bacteroidales bacterium Barb7]|nr:TonB-linked outer membrane protein, SusC/RagA family [Bacteroidales bacterium Barb7]
MAKVSYFSGSRKRLLYFLLFSFVAWVDVPLALAQRGIVVRGKVIDSRSKESVIGASVSVRNDKKSAGTATDLDGVFSISVSALPATIVVSYIGYKQQEIDIYEETNERINIRLVEDLNALEEVVVVGYGTQKRKELTGSVASVDKTTLQQLSTSLDGLLGGAVSGVNVTQVSGQPGSGSEIRIRGGNSIYASNDPLYVIDGFIYFSEKGATQAGVGGIESSLNPLASINPSDIESIEILKDVSAKAIYGSRGANGVILVTTKKGKRGGNSIHYQYSIGVDQSAKKLKLTNAEQWSKINRDVFSNTTWGDPNFVAFNSAQIAANGKNTDTDWQDAVLQTGSTQIHELSVSGGDDKTRYLISGNYTDQQGIIINSGFERFSGRINLDRELFKNLTVGVTASADRSTQNALTSIASGDKTGDSAPALAAGITNSLVYALFMPPVLPVRNAATGDYNYYNPFELNQYLNYSGKAVNPVSDLNNSIGQTLSTSLLGNFYAKYNIPHIDGLVFKFSAGTNFSHITQNLFSPPTSALGFSDDIKGKGSVGNRETTITQTEYLLTYTKQLAPAHYIDLLGGYTNQQTNTNIILSRATHLANFEELGLGKELPHFNKSNSAYLHSVLGRVNYTLLDKYNFTATYRADKSSRFAAGNEWGYFPSVGFSWNVSDESFFEGAKNSLSLSNLKFRASYGTAGNQEIGFDEFSAVLEAVRYGGEAAYKRTNLGNSKLKWETTAEYNAGIDAGFLNDRLSFVADVYSKKTSDLLVKVLVPFSATNELQTINVGNVTNKGFELALNARLVERKKFNWSVSANIAHNTNTITHLGKSNNLTEGDYQEKIYREGESVGSFYGFVYEGVDQKTGDANRKDLDGDKKVRPSTDRTVLGSIQPDFTYGLSSNLTWHRWDAFVSLQGSQGNEVYNKLRRHLSEGNKTYNLSDDVLNAWTEEKPSSSIPSLNAAAVTREPYSRYIEDASFLKIRNITVGYNFPVKIGNLPLQFRAFASAQNLYTFTKYKGYDPEVAGGIDTGIYPSSRTFLAGAGITF